MVTVNITVTDEAVQPGIYLGRQGEKQAREIVLDLSAMREKYGAGTATLYHQRSKDPAPYLIGETTGTTLTWTVSETDTVYAGIGYCEVRYTFGTEGLSKSAMFATNVKASLSGDVIIPAATQAWYDALVEYIDEHCIAREQLAQAVADYIEAHPLEGIPSGGAEGQVLVKKSGTDFDAEWGDGLSDLKSALSKAETEALTYVASKNLYNPSEDTIGAYINAKGVIIVNGGAANVTGKIYAEIGRTIYISNNGSPKEVTRVSYYKADDTWTRNVDSTKTIELANGEAYFRVFYNNNILYMQFEYDRITEYEAYFAPYYKKCATVSDLDNYVSETDFEALETKVNGIEEDIPSYFEPQLESVFDTVHKNLQAVGQNGESFVFFTDQHWADNEKHSPALIRKILKNTTIKTVVCGGDILNRGTKDVELPRAMAFAQAMNGTNYLYAFGNHDANAFDYTSDYTSPEAQANILTRNEVYALYESQLSDDQTIVWNTRSKPDIRYGVGNDYYIDKPCTKTRYLILDSGWYGWGQDASKNFVSSALSSLGDEWHCVIVVHIPFINGGLSQYLKYCVLPSVATYSSKVAAIVGGHTHYDMVLYTSEGIPIIVTDTDSLLYDHEHGNVATAGTVTEQCIDIMAVDYDNDRVKCARIGRGSDRIINAGINGVSSTITLIPSLASTVSSWASDNASIATVANGTVTAVANGTCIITATYNSGTKESWFVSVSM